MNLRGKSQSLQLQTELCSTAWPREMLQQNTKFFTRTPALRKEADLCQITLQLHVQGTDLINQRSAKRGSMLAVVLMQRFLRVPASAPANARRPDEAVWVPAGQGKGLLLL